MLKTISKCIKLKAYPSQKAVRLINASENVKKQFASLIDDGWCHVFAKVLLGKAIGMVFLLTNLDDKSLADGKNVCYICNFFVQPKFRGMGMGTEIMEHIFCVAKENGFKQMTIGVDESNEKNVRMYKKLGFTTELKKSSLDATIKDKDGNHLRTKEHLILVKGL